MPLGAHPALADFVPSKLYDGLAAGRPLVVAAAGEPAALVRELGAGVAVPPEDPAALAEAVAALAADPARARELGLAGRAAARGPRTRRGGSRASRRSCARPLEAAA